MKTIQERMEEHIHLISEFTATPGSGTTRFTYSQEDLKTRNYIKEKMKKLGLEVREDGLGNIFGKLEGTLKDGPSVLIGSHFDSVPNGGAYDGPAGVVTALEVATLFVENQLKPKYPLEVVALIEEEGARFAGGLMGSRGMVGALSEEEFYALKDKEGISTVDAMKAIGLDPKLPKIRDPKTMKAFLELHIEQGPFLEERNIPIGIVDAIVGLAQLEVTVEGKAGHAGTTPMDRRADALVKAAEIIAELPKLALEEGEGTVITTGRLNVYPNGANVIPDRVVFSIDIRSGKEEHVQNVIKKVKDLLDYNRKNGIEISVEQSLYMEPKMLDEDIKEMIKQTCNDLNLDYLSMNSGAGHDAMVLSDVTDVGLIFIPSRDGLSHCPEEWSDARHIANGVQIYYEVAKRLTEAE